MLHYPNSSNKLPVAFDAWKLIQTKETELIKISLRPGESVEPHLNDVPVVFYCISGKGNVTAGEQKGIFEQGGAVFIEPGVSRAIGNAGINLLEVIVFKLMSLV